MHFTHLQFHWPARTTVQQYPTLRGEARDRRRDGNILLKCYTRYVLVTTYKLCCLLFYILDSQLPHNYYNLLQLLLSLLPLVQFRLVN